MSVPTKYRNVLCPWQTPREIRAQSSFLDRMCKRLPETTVRALLRLDGPDRAWSAK